MHHGKAEFKVHSLDLDKSKRPVDSVIIHPARHKHELLRLLFNSMAERARETKRTIRQTRVTKQKPINIK